MRTADGTLPWRAPDKERRTIFLKYGQHGTVVPRTPGNNCAFYDLTDPRLSAPTPLSIPSLQT